MCPKCGRPGSKKRIRLPTLVIAAFLCGITVSNLAHRTITSDRGRVYYRGVHSGARERVDYFYDLTADCKVVGYPEITVTRNPDQGSVSTERGPGEPAYTTDNVRFQCDKAPVGATLLFYQSRPAFHGRDWFTVLVRYPNSELRTESFVVNVM